MCNTYLLCFKLGRPQVRSDSSVVVRAV
uniref:Uncharacterized protein n=1 Tax=Anguilla anguilla TaxID=7936 RepID=A0A0E9QPQ3_ANGAN